MYESYYGFAEKPFSLTPDPKYLYRSQSHANAFDLLQYAIRRREGFVVVTGDIGTGKTTLCRAVLEQIDRTTFTALVLNPFISEEDLLKLILQDFGVVSREEAKAGRLVGVSKQGLIEALYDFLLSLIPLKASAVLIIDEAQNLPPSVLEQIRILSNLETDKEKLLQIILVGQLNLQTVLRSPEMRQLDQRVSIRYELKPLDQETVAAYIGHRLTIAGGSAAVTFAPKALQEVHRLSGGIPRLINMICDRALLAAYSVRANRITPEMVGHAAESLDLPTSRMTPYGWFKRRASLVAGAGVVLSASMFAVGATAYLYQRLQPRIVQAATQPVATFTATSVSGWSANRQLPADATVTILVGSYPTGVPASEGQIRSITDWLDRAGLHAYYADVDLGALGHWRRVFAGAYANAGRATRDVERLKASAPGLDLRAIDAREATRVVSAPSQGVSDSTPRSETEP
jgi:type II secretory pathway predicted ATPase ExeA